MASVGLDISVRGKTDAQDRLIEADEALEQLQMRCGGVLPGVLAIPELYELVRQARIKGLRLAREFTAYDGKEDVSGFVRISPLREDGEAGCEVLIENWQQEEHLGEHTGDLTETLDDIDRMVAELSARLDPDLKLLTANAKAPDLTECVDAMAANRRAPWSDFIELAEADYRQPLHWRLIDGARATVAGSQRDWRVRLLPIGLRSESPDGFELLLVSEQPWLMADEDSEGRGEASTLVGEELTRVLRQPISRIISNAETIRMRLAGPLREEYTNYAGDIASAGSHLLALLDDLADLEAVESEQFSVTQETVDLADVAEHALGILRVKSADKGIAIEHSTGAGTVLAKGEFRRVLQILINIIGNAVNYSPADSVVRIDTAAADGRASISVSDEGAGLSVEQQRRIFTKFERLGREGDGGSGLGLYISQRLAKAMDGELRVASTPGKGAVFTLDLPAVK